MSADDLTELEAQVIDEINGETAGSYAIVSVEIGKVITVAIETDEPDYEEFYGGF